MLILLLAVVLIAHSYGPKVIYIYKKSESERKTEYEMRHIANKAY